MKINNINDYLEYRIIVLSNELYELKGKKDNNNILISEITAKINELKTSVDEAFEMFSPNAAEEQRFNRQEVRDLQMRQVILLDDNKKIMNRTAEIDNEIKIISNLKQQSDNKEKNTAQDMKAIKDKIEVCLDFIDLDSRRVKLELKKLNDLLKKK